MAAAQEARIKQGNLKLQPYYVGKTEGTFKGKKISHTHYVLIRAQVAARLGLKAKSIIKPGTDSQVDGVVFRNVTRKKKGKQTSHQSKRYIDRYSKTIEVYLDSQIKLADGTKAWESYHIGFPSSVPLRLIREFLAKNCPKVVRYNTGRNFYQVR